jgi:hypothetical protein
LPRPKVATWLLPTSTIIIRGDAPTKTRDD